MIKLDGLTEIPELKTEELKPYLNIKPSEAMTDQEAADYISKEFDAVHEESDGISIDRLKDELFNRSEDEIIIDFDITDQLKKQLENFDPERWQANNENERINAIKNLINELGKEMGLKDIPHYIVEEYEGGYGYYDPKSNTITLNKTYMSDPVELVNTISHELRHAFQYMRAEIMETWEDTLFRINHEYYVKPIDHPILGIIGYMHYYNQYVEVDARVFADKIMEAMK